MADIANYIAQNRPNFNRASIDRQHFGNALMRNEVARIPQQNRAQDLGLQAAEQTINQRGQQFTDEQKTNARMILSRGFAAIGQSPQPKITALQFISSPDFQAAGKLVGLPVEHFAKAAEMQTDDNVRAGSIDWARILGSEVASQQSYGDAYAGPDGSMLQRGPDGRVTAVLPRVPQQASQAAPDRELVAIVGPDGKPVLVPRPQAVGEQPYQKPTGGLSPRDASTAKNKLTQIAVARQALAVAREKFGALRGSMSAGPAGGLLPTQAGTAFDTAVNSMRQIIGGITRVPGVGSMSDYESRLAEAALPKRSQYEANTLQQLDSLEAMLNQMEIGYQGLLGDGGSEPDSVLGPDPKAFGPQPQSGGWSIRRID